MVTYHLETNFWETNLGCVTLLIEEWHQPNLFEVLHVWGYKEVGKC